MDNLQILLKEKEKREQNNLIIKEIIQSLDWSKSIQKSIVYNKIFNKLNIPTVGADKGWSTEQRIVRQQILKILKENNIKAIKSSSKHKFAKNKIV